MAGRGIDLKNEEEVKDYLENIGTEYRWGCYYEKNPVGKIESTNTNIRQGSNTCIKVVQLCHKSFDFLLSISACHLLADYMEAVKGDFQKAYKVYQTNCDAYKSGISCCKVAMYKMTGRGGCKQDIVSYKQR